MELWLSRHVYLPLYHVNTCTLCGAKKSSSEPIILLSNSRGVFSTRNSQTATFSFNPELQFMALEFNLLAYILFRLVLTLNEFRIYKVINVGLS